MLTFVAAGVTTPFLSNVLVVLASRAAVEGPGSTVVAVYYLHFVLFLLVDWRYKSWRHRT